MKRIILMFLRNFAYAPGMLIRLFHYARHTTRYSDEFLYDYVRDITFHALKGGKVHVTVSGTENIPADQNFIFFPNHQGFFDVLAIVAACPKPFRVIYKKELKRIPFLKSVFSCLHAIDIDRDDIRQSLTVINQMAEQVRDGHNFLIFAEGTRSRDGNQLLPFKGGTFKAAFKAGCPVVPIALIDTYKVFDIGDTKEITVSVEFLPPVAYEEYHALKTQELAALVHDRIQAAINADRTANGFIPNPPKQ